ncbi:MAG: FeoB-associated Cys-rich membrane protein [Candidatus Krumholzibacteriia bacterium]
MSLDVVITGVILAGASAWAGRRLWRATRPKTGSPDGPGCGGGCAGCPVSDLRAQRPQDICASPERREH